jgi:hypothetical protein
MQQKGSERISVGPRAVCSGGSSFKDMAATLQAVVADSYGNR